MKTLPHDPDHLSEPELWESQGRRELEVQCALCRDVYSMWIFPADLEAFKAGQGYIQNPMPYLTPDERELLMNQTCGPCFDKLCPPDED